MNILYEELDLMFKHYSFIHLNDQFHPFSARCHILIVEEAVYKLREEHPKYPYIKVCKPINYIPFKTQNEFSHFKKSLSPKWRKFKQSSENINNLHFLKEKIYRYYCSDKVDVLTHDEYLNEKTIFYYTIRRDQTIRKYKEINYIIKNKYLNKPHILKIFD